MRRRTLLVTGCTALAAALAGCSEETSYEDGNGAASDDDHDDESGDDTTDDDTENGGGDDGGEPDVDEVVEILEHELVREDKGEMHEGVSVEGRAENTGDEQLSYVEIRVRFYNEDGDLLESFIDNISDLDPGQTWSFDVSFPGMGDDAAEVDDYDIAVGTSF